MLDRSEPMTNKNTPQQDPHDSADDADLVSSHEETHRGAFGEFGGETSAFIERTFRGSGSS